MTSTINKDFNKENIPNPNISNNNTNNTTNNNTLYKSLPFNGNPSLSKISSIKKHSRKKSSISIPNTNNINNSQKLHSYNLNHKKSSSSITSNTIFRNLSTKSSIDSIFMSARDSNLNQRSLTNHPNSTFLMNNDSILSTPNGSENDFFYNSDENLSDDNESRSLIDGFQCKKLNTNTNIDTNADIDEDNCNNTVISTTNIRIDENCNNIPNIIHSSSDFNIYNDNEDNNIVYKIKNKFDQSIFSNVNDIDNIDNIEDNKHLDIINKGKMDNDNYNDEGDDADDDDDENDFGSPLQKKNHFTKNKLFSKFKLQRHQSLMQFGIKNTNKFDTDQLTCNIKGLSVNSEEDNLNCGNSILRDASFKFSEYENSGIPRISVEEFKKILKEYENRHKTNGKFCKHFDELMIIDCRFNFEFNGGHIDGALNISSNTELEKLFFQDSILNSSPLEFNQNKRKLLVFHCEFSSYRGPMKADHLRSIDRKIAGEFYPNLYYPDVLILEGGYKDYYESEKSLRKSLSYIEMDHPLFEAEKERNLTLMRKESDLSRKNSYSSNQSVSRKTSHGSIKSISSSMLDFTSMNKFDINQPVKPRSSKRFLHSASDNNFNSNNNNHNTNNNHKNHSKNNSIHQNEIGDDYLSSLSTPKGYGLFGGFGTQNIDLDSLVDDEEDNNIFDQIIDNDIDDTTDKVNLNIFNNSTNQPNTKDTFKIPLPRPRVNRRSNLHSRSNTVSTFTFSNNAGFKSVPLLSTPEKVEAKFSNIFYQHSKANETTGEININLNSDFNNTSNNNDYKSFYSNKNSNFVTKHSDTPISKGKH